MGLVVLFCGYSSEPSASYHDDPACILYTVSAQLNKGHGKLIQNMPTCFENCFYDDHGDDWLDILQFEGIVSLVLLGLDRCTVLYQVY